MSCTDIGAYTQVDAPVGGRVYNSVRSAIDALRELRRDRFGARSVDVTREVYDSFDPMMCLDLAFTGAHSECYGMGDNRDFAHLEVVDRGSLSKWDAAVRDFKPYRWMLCWQRPGRKLLLQILRAAAASYHGTTLVDDSPMAVAALEDGGGNARRSSEGYST